MGITIFYLALMSLVIILHVRLIFKINNLEHSFKQFNEEFLKLLKISAAQFEISGKSHLSCYFEIQNEILKLSEKVEELKGPKKYTHSEASKEAIRAKIKAKWNEKTQEEKEAIRAKQKASKRSRDAAHRQASKESSASSQSL